MNAAWHTKLTAARLWIISAPNPALPADRRDSPRGQAYLASALYRLTPVATDQVARMTVDEKWRLYVNADWLNATDVPEVGREMAHLLWHLLDNHADRARACGVHDESAARWRDAADKGIARFTQQSGLLPSSIERLDYHDLRSQALVEADFTDAETDDELADDSCGSGADGVRRPYELTETDGLPTVTRLDAESIALDVAVGLRDGHEYGSRNGSAMRWASGIAEPKVPWRQVLASAVRRVATTVAGRGDYTYRRPSRRNASQPRIVMPSQHQPTPEVAVVVDTSGSMDADLLAIAVAELDSILAALGLGDRGVHAVSVDTTAVSTRVRRAADVPLLGGGGTDMSIGVAVAAELRPRPELVVVFTDGYTPWPDAAPDGTTVVAALVGRRGSTALPPTPEWMVRVECAEDQ